MEKKCKEFSMVHAYEVKKKFSSKYNYNIVYIITVSIIIYTHYTCIYSIYIYYKAILVGCARLSRGAVHVIA